MRPEEILNCIQNMDNGCALLEGSSGSGKTQLLKKLKADTSRDAHIFSYREITDEIIRTKCNCDYFLRDIAKQGSIVCIEDVDYLAPAGVTQRYLAKMVQIASADHLVIMTGIKLRKRTPFICSGCSAEVFELDDPSDTKNLQSILSGRIKAIRLADCDPMTNQSCDMQVALLEYKDKRITISHVRGGEFGAFHIEQGWTTGAENSVYIEKTDIIVFDHVSYDDGELDGITFRWNDTWLHIFRDEYNLILTRSSFDLTGRGRPSPDGEPELELI